MLEFDRQPNGELGQLGVQIRKKRFEGYNQAWISMCAPDVVVAAPSMNHIVDDDDLISLGPNGLPGANRHYFNDNKMVSWEGWVKFCDLFLHFMSLNNFIRFVIANLQLVCSRLAIKDLEPKGWMRLMI